MPSGSDSSVSLSLDAELVSRIAERHDDAAAAQLYRRHGAAMLAMAIRISKDVAIAEEAVQDAFLQAWRDADSFDAERGSVLAWLLIMTRGRTLDRLRSRQVRERGVCHDVDVHTAAAPEVSFERALDVQSAMQAVNEILTILPVTDRETVELAYFEGLTHTELAGRLNVPLGTAKTRLRRGMQTLRAAMTDRTRPPFQWKTAPDGADAPALALRGLRILVVDDEPDSLRLTMLVLTRAGALVTTAASASEALARLDTVWPDLVLTDLDMPGEDGFALMTRLEVLRISRRRPLPAIAFTAYAADGDRERTRSAGFELHLTKPIRPARLVQDVASLVKKFS